MFQFLFRATLLLVAFGGMAFVGYGLRVAIAPPSEQATGAEIRVMCQECGKVEVARVKQIRACFCSECDAPVGEAWRCLAPDCRKVFPFVARRPKNRAAGKAGLRDWFEAHACPYCRSLRTEPVPVEEERKSKGSQATAKGSPAPAKPVASKRRGR